MIDTRMESIIFVHQSSSNFLQHAGMFTTNLKILVDKDQVLVFHRKAKIVFADGIEHCF